MINAAARKILFISLLVVLLLPFIQHCIPFIKSGPLVGGFGIAKDVQFTLNHWLEQTYQHDKELFVNDNTGFRPDFVRLNTQIDFSFFEKCHSGWTVLGQKNYLFQDPYIEAYYGQDFVGYDTVHEKLRKLKAIKDTLSHLGKSLIIVYAPNKAAYYPEYLPKHRIRKNISMTNLEAYKLLADSLGMDQIDMNAWFVTMKNKTKELLYAKQGIHWTVYGCFMAGDSLMRYIERIRNIKVPHPDWSQIEHTQKARLGDDDVASELNLVFPVTTETFAYPVIKENPDTTKVKPNVIYIGDSYCMKVAAFSVLTKMNTQCEYWGYFDDVIHLNDPEHTYIKYYDWHGAINKTDCIVILYTPFNLRCFGHGFIESAYNYYYPSLKSTTSK